MRAKIRIPILTMVTLRFLCSGIFDAGITANTAAVASDCKVPEHSQVADKDIAATYNAHGADLEVGMRYWLQNVVVPDVSGNREIATVQWCDDVGLQQEQAL